MGAESPITAILSTKGQLIIPKSIRDQRRWPAGTRLTVENTEDGVLLKMVPIFAETQIDAVFGSLRHDGPALAIATMDKAVTEEARRRARD